MALAYFITFTIYGTWLHGSSKGKGSVDAEHNEFGTPFVEPDADREQQAREAMVQPAYVMAPRNARLSARRSWNWRRNEAGTCWRRTYEAITYMWS
jgi:hypothetical protein